MKNAESSKHGYYQLSINNSKYRWIMLSILCVCFFLYSANWFVIVPAIPAIITETSISNSQALTLVSVFLLTYGLFQIPSGLLAAKWSAKRTFIFALILESFSSCLIFFVQDYYAILLSRLIAGVGAGLFFSAAVGTITPWFLHTKQLSLAISLTTGAFFNLGTALPIFVGPTFISLYGWRLFFLVLGILGIIIAGIASVIVKNPPKRIDDLDSLPIWSGVKKAFQNRNIWFFGFAFAGVMGSMNAFTGFMPEFLTTYRGWDSSTAGLFTALGAFSGVFVIPLVGILSDKLESRKPQVVIGGLISFMFVWLFGQIETTIIWILPFIVTISTNLVFINSFAAPIEYLGTKMGNVGLGLMMTIGVVGSTWIPAYMGFLVDEGVKQYGIVPSATSIAWLFLTIVNLSAVVFGLIIREPKKNKI